MRPSACAAAGLLALAACGGAPPTPQVMAENVVVQLPFMPGRPGAAYFTLTSNNDPTKLVGVTSPKVERIELHESLTKGGVSRMRPLESAVFSDNLKLEFAPGGKHAMLLGLDPTLKAGDRIALTFRFDPAPPVTVEAEVRAFGASHDGH